MSELSNEYIEDAFSKVRAKFERRNNITGLEILDGYEECQRRSKNTPVAGVKIHHLL